MGITVRGKPLTKARIIGALRHRMRSIFPGPPQTPQLLRSLPWITDGAIDAIEQFITDRRREGRLVTALEFGAGASTIWLANRVDSLISFEHDEGWHSAIAKRVEQDGLENVVVRRYPRPYYQHIDALPDMTFDIILVDGRDRVECIRRAVRKLATHGLMVLDNSERLGTRDAPGAYFAVIDILPAWEREDYIQLGPDRTGWVSPHRWMTTVWRGDGQA